MIGPAPTEITTMFLTVEWVSKIQKMGDARIVVLPDELVLEGEAIIRQDEWGDITIYPMSPEGRKALERFGPFADVIDDESPGNQGSKDE
jgi:hypothetical protein